MDSFVSDFFFPNTGGVESHLYHLSRCLVLRGHKVIIITHHYGGRVGVRYISSGVKVYYLPLLVVYQQATFPNLWIMFPLFRDIMLRERIEIVHGHQAFSSLCHESIFHAGTMGLKTCFTDHSLFGFADTSNILTNKFLKFSLSVVNHIICVSHTSKENTVLRAALDPWNVSVIPNAVIADDFTPSPTTPDPQRLTIVVMSRLVYRKGLDLLVAVIPRICAKFDHVYFLIGGDGPKRLDLEQMREKYLLHHRVKLVGSLPNHQVRQLLIQGHVFLNTSLTEAFCIGVVEAASCGLSIVSTRVGGVPEVLPPSYIRFSKAEENGNFFLLTLMLILGAYFYGEMVLDLVDTLSRAIEEFDFKTFPQRALAQHGCVKGMYDWHDVAARTELVYEVIMQKTPYSLIERLRLYATLLIVKYVK